MFLRMLRLVTVMAVIAYASAATDAFSKRAVFPGIGEYFYFDVPVNWTTAFRTCDAFNAHLAVIESSAEAAALKQMMADNGATSIHLGFRDRWIEGDYINIFDKPINSKCTCGNEWAVGSPKGGTKYQCGGFSAAGITDTACDLLQVFICEIPTTTPHRNFTTVPGFGMYKYIPTNVQWHESAKICRDLGAHMMIINSQAEVDAVISAFNIRTGFNVGVYRSYKADDKFYSVLGQRLSDTGYSIWSSGSPYDSGLLHLWDQFVAYWPHWNGLATIGFTSYHTICELDLR